MINKPDHCKVLTVFFITNTSFTELKFNLKLMINFFLLHIPK